jgi:hypothetical protein
MSDFVDPVPERLPLSDGQFVDIKQRLNHGEREDMFAGMSAFVTPGEPAQLDRKHFRTAKVLAYLIGWSLTNKGRPVPYSPELPERTRTDTLRSLSPDRFDEIHQAIEAHEAAQAQKKMAAGATASSPSSPLPASMAGSTATS